MLCKMSKIVVAMGIKTRNTAENWFRNEHSALDCNHIFYVEILKQYS